MTSARNINNKFSIRKVKTILIFGKQYPVITPSSLIRFVKEINNFKPNIIHTHNRYMISTWIGILYGVFRKIPILHTEHAHTKNNFSSKFATYIATFLDNTIVRFLLKRANQITAVSNSVKAYLESDFHIHNTALTYNFVNPKELSKQNEENHNLQIPHSNQKKLITFIGRLVETKGISRFLETTEACQFYPDLLFLVVGEGPYQKSVQSHAKELTNLHYLGSCTHEKCLQVIKKSEVIVNLSSLEGLSTTLLEASYFNKKILATNIPPNLELLESYQNVEFVSPGESIKDHLMKLVNKPLAKQQNWNTKYSLETTASIYKDLYAKTVNI
jgi:glycosyltransferase involved in cell wall biosynthesis